MGFDQYFESGEQKQVKGHFANLIKIAKADGVLGPKEHSLLKKLAKNFHITEEEFEAMISGESTYEFIPPVMKEDRYSRFVNLIRMMMADGEMEYFEHRALKRLAAGLSLKDDKVDELILKTIEAINAGDDNEDIVEQYDKWLK